MHGYDFSRRFDIVDAVARPDLDARFVRRVEQQSAKRTAANGDRGRAELCAMGAVIHDGQPSPVFVEERKPGGFQARFDYAFRQASARNALMPFGARVRKAPSLRICSTGFLS